MLLGQVREPTAWLLTSPEAYPALRLYRGRGWWPEGRVGVSGSTASRLIMVLHQELSSGCELEDPARFERASGLHANL